MNETHTFKAVVVKILAIIGFLVTIVVVVFLGIKGFARLPEAFASLASLAQSIQNYRPVTEITVTPEKRVVNSEEQFKITWSDARQAGEYHFTYTCTEGIDLAVRGENDDMVSIACTDTLTLPSDVHGLFLRATSDTMRFVEVPFVVTFTNENKEQMFKSNSAITVVNAQIPATPVATIDEPTTPIPTQPVVVKPVETPEPVVTPAPTPVTPKPVVIPVPKPVPPAVTPQPTKPLFTDLAVTTLGSGVLTNGIFSYTAKYDRDLKNAIKFDIKNIGTKTSAAWSFTTILPSGEVYKSPMQLPLQPFEHVEFTLGFDLAHDSKDTLVKITNTVVTSDDTNAKNNSATWFVTVQD